MSTEKEGLCNIKTPRSVASDGYIWHKSRLSRYLSLVNYKEVFQQESIDFKDFKSRFFKILHKFHVIFIQSHNRS